MFEIHIAVPELSFESMRLAFVSFQSIGLTKSKYFAQVYNVPQDGSQQLNTPPTGHDLEKPGAMTTAKVSTLEEAILLVKAAMNILRALRIEGNFEIEELINGKSHTIDMELLSGFERVPDSPTFENHIIWKGPLSEVPSTDKVIQLVEKVYGYKPHQIVDFAHNPTPEHSDVISRVATIYQPNVEETAKCAETLNQNKTTLACAYTVAEQVHIVGQWKK